jgi:(1->4)-alpha-D-glucan 1-alpha-D-glucosylmutase
VDPDNRGPVDYETRQSMLDEIQAGLSLDEIMRRVDSGMPKLWLIYRALNLRREHPEWFGAEAAYTPLIVDGSKREHLVGYIRAATAITLIPRWTLKLGDSWAATTVDLPEGRWKNILTGEAFQGGRVRVQPLLRKFPVALLTKETE